MGATLTLTHLSFRVKAPALPRGLVWQAVFSERGLRGLSISRRGADKGLREIDGRAKLRAKGACEPLTPRSHSLTSALSLKGRGKTASDARVRALIRKLQARLAGKRVDLAWREFDLRGFPDFHVRVWKAMHAVPFGEVRSYREIARAAGSPRAFRAVGQACGANPILLFIPCHRVVSSSGLGGFGCGIEWKKRLLATEGVDWRTLKLSLPSQVACR
jgi:methylated-DNA-[protein]-cysteine S-methyltransferase